MEQNRIFEASPSRENELLQTLFWTKKGTPPRFVRMGNFVWLYGSRSICQSIKQLKMLGAYGIGPDKVLIIERDDTNHRTGYSDLVKRAHE